MASADKHVLSRAGEDYLESIYRLSSEPDSAAAAVRSVDVADDLGVSKASVNKALSMLKEAGMVSQSRYGSVTLTEAGRDYAATVWDAHRLLRTFLVRELGVEPEVAEDEACRMEHCISADTKRRLARYLEDRA